MTTGIRPTAADLKAEIAGHLARSRSVCDSADARGSDLTAAELAEGNQHLAAAKAAAKTLRGMQSTTLHANFKHTAEDLGAIFPAEDDDAGYAPPRGSKVGSWGAKAIAEHSDQFGRFKGLAPVGTIMVNIPAPAPIPMASPATDVRQLIPSELSAGVYAYLRQTSRVSNAAVVPAGSLKPTSTFGLVRIQGQVVTVAHISEGINRADLADSALLGSFLDNEMRQGLANAVTAQIVSGDGIGENFDGLLSVDGTIPVAFVPGLTDGLGVVATARRSITTLELLGSKVDGFLLNPVDWERAEMASSTTGDLVLADAGVRLPIDAAAQRLFGRPVVTSVAVPQGTGIAAEFAASTRLFVREEAVIEWGTGMFDPDAFGPGVGASDWARNLFRMRCEARMALGVLRPAGIAILDLTV